MKPRILWCAVVAIGFAEGREAFAQNVNSAVSTNRVAPGVTPIVSAPVAAPSLSSPPLVAPLPRTPSITQPPATDESVVAQLPVILASPSTALATSEEDTQRRLEAPTPDQLMEKYGSVGFLIRKPEARNFVQMLNPFAGPEYGGKRQEIYNRDPNLKPGATLPRTFIRDGIRNEPDLKLIGFPW